MFATVICFQQTALPTHTADRGSTVANERAMFVVTMQTTKVWHVQHAEAPGRDVLRREGMCSMLHLPPCARYSSGAQSPLGFDLPYLSLRQHAALVRSQSHPCTNVDLRSHSRHQQRQNTSSMR